MQSFILVRGFLNTILLLNVDKVKVTFKWYLFWKATYTETHDRNCDSKLF